jgi:Zn finger protein HypA/HybF involved in hydrogenase expression
MNHPVGVCKSCGDPYDLEEWDDGYCNTCMGEASVISLFELPIVSEHDQQPQD